MTGETDREVREELERLRQEHRDLDAAIAAMADAANADPIRIQRLKKRKLMLKDRIQLMIDQNTPDIIA